MNMALRAVYKTTAAEFLDDFYSGDGRDTAHQDALEMLDMPGSLVETTRALAARFEHFDNEHVDKFQSHWLEPSSHRGHQSVDRVLRFGYRQAVKLASERGVPIENFWIAGAGPDVELHICDARDRVVCFMFTPVADTRKYGSERAQSRSWIVRAGDLAEIDERAPREVLDGDNPSIVSIQVSGPLPG